MSNYSKREWLSELPRDTGYIHVSCTDDLHLKNFAKSLDLEFEIHDGEDYISFREDIKTQKDANDWLIMIRRIQSALGQLEASLLSSEGKFDESGQD